MEKLKRLAEKTGFIIGYTFAIMVGLLVLSWAFRFLWESGKAIWKVLTK